MNKAFRILLAVLLAQFSLLAEAQEKKDLFNPVNYAVVSQTIALMSTLSTGIQLSIHSVSHEQEWHSTSLLGFVLWSTI